MNHDLLAPHPLHHHIVVHVPVQHAGNLQLFQLFQLQPDGTGGEPRALGIVDQLRQVDAPHRRRHFAPQLGQTDVVAVRRGDHRQTGKTTLLIFRLQNALNLHQLPM